MNTLITRLKAFLLSFGEPNSSERLNIDLAKVDKTQVYLGYLGKEIPMKDNGDNLKA